jgi:hypothetical protein
MFSKWMKSGYLLWMAWGLTIILRLFFIHIRFFSVDEAVSAVAANAILDGGVPYLDAIDHRGPLTYYVYALIFALFGKNQMIILHWVYLGVMLVITGLVWCMGYQIKGKKLAGWTALLFSIFTWVNPFHEMWAAHTEWLLVLFSLIGFNIYLYYHQRRQEGFSFLEAIWLFMTGFCLGIAVLSKQVAILDMAALGGFLIIARILGFSSTSQFLREGVLLSLGWVVPILITGWFFWHQEALQDFYFYVWQYNTEYYLKETTLPDRLEAWAKLWGGFLINKWLLVVLWGVGISQLKKFRDLFHEKNQLLLLILIWLGATILEAMAGSRAFLHYLIPALPPMVLLGGMIIQRIYDGWQAYSPTMRSFINWAVVVGLGFPILYTFIQYRDILDHDASISEFEVITEHIIEQTKPNERIFVWGFAPEIYVLTDRKPASRYSFCNVLTGHLPAQTESLDNTDHLIVPGTWDILMKELETHRPTYIVDTQPADYRAYGKYPMFRYPELKELIQQSYQFDSLFHQQNPEVIFHLYRRKNKP